MNSVVRHLSFLPRVSLVMLIIVNSTSKNSLVMPVTIAGLRTLLISPMLLCLIVATAVLIVAACPCIGFEGFA